MGLFNKIKDILFDDEECTDQIKITPDMRNEEIEEVKEEIQKEDKKEESFRTPIKFEEEVKIEPQKDISDNNMYKNDSTFPFFDDFDEAEFDRHNGRVAETKVVQRPEIRQEVRPQINERTTMGPYDYERRKITTKRTDYGRYERTEVTETVERKKFKPSPVISPVYGILNQDYDNRDIKQRNNDKVDVDMIRNKAFGPKIEKPINTYYEESETVTVSKPEEKERKVKTIDELLEDTSDVMVDLKDELDFNEENIPKKANTDSDDLFDLIDAMYDSKEDGE